MRVLYLPLGPQTGTCNAWNDVGVNLSVYDYWTSWLQYNNRHRIKTDFLKLVGEFQPHLIHMQLQFTGLVDVETLQEARKICPGVIITNWSGDVRANAQHEFTSLGNAVDYSLISSTGQLEMYHRAGCGNVRYWQIGFDPKVAFPQNKTNFKYDISFLGNNYGHTFPDGPLRLKAAQALMHQFGGRFGLFGTGYSGRVKPISHHECNNIYNDSCCVLSISNFNNIEHYFSDRLLLCLASGRPTISWYFPGCENYFVDRRDIFIARSNQDIINIVNFCKNNPEVASQVGMNGYNKVLNEHTFTSRIIELLHIVGLTHLL